MRNFRVFLPFILAVFFIVVGFGQPAKTDGGTKPSTVAVRNVPRPEIYPDGPYFAQPVFQSVQDSIDYHRVQARLLDPSFGDRKRELDSLRTVSLRLTFEKIVRYRKVYKGSPGFRSLTSIPDTSLSMAEKVSVFKAKRFPKKIFKCTSLNDLEFVQCSIKRVPRKLKALHVKTLRVYDNQSKSPLKLARNKTIEVLLVRGVDARNIPIRFERLEKLRSLDLAMAGIEEIPKSIFSVSTLKLLKLGGNKITLKDFHFPVNTTLSAIELSGNRIETVPSTIGNLSGLTSLTMNNNKIERIEEGIGQLQKLTQLTFYRNNIKALPKSIYTLSELKEIDLYYNQIEKLEEDAGQWRKMERLYLSFNKLISLPGSIASLTSLRELYAHDNRISSLPDQLGQMGWLKVLRVNNNFLLNLPGSFAGLSSIENIDVSNNGLTEVPDGLWNLEKLELLSLGANPWSLLAWRTIQMRAEELRQRQVVVRTDVSESEN